MAAAKGAPETIFDLCRLIPEQRRPLIEVIKEMAGKGLRVLAVAHCDVANDDALATEEDLTQATFSFDGLVGFRDPVRPMCRQRLRAPRRHSGRDDHRRLSGNGDEYCTAVWPRYFCRRSHRA